jgi:hypothetical protein
LVYLSGTTSTSVALYPLNTGQAAGNLPILGVVLNSTPVTTNGASVTVQLGGVTQCVFDGTRAPVAGHYFVHSTAADGLCQDTGSSDYPTTNVAVLGVVLQSGTTDNPAPVYLLGPQVVAGAGGSTGPTGPTGPSGAAATISVGTVTTGASGSSVTVVNAGTSSAAIFDFTIPQGPTGPTGASGTSGFAWVGNAINGTDALAHYVPPTDLYALGSSFTTVQGVGNAYTPAACTVKSLSVHAIVASSDTSETTTFTVWHNGAVTSPAMTCTVSTGTSVGAITSCSDTTHTFTVNAGDSLEYAVTQSSGVSTINIYYSTLLICN